MVRPVVGNLLLQRAVGGYCLDRLDASESTGMPPEHLEADAPRAAIEPPCAPK